MSNRLSDGRSNLAKGIDWATRISTACLTMVLPCVGGYYLDLWLGTMPVFVLIFLALGMALGIYQLVRITQILGDSMDSKSSDFKDDGRGKQ